MGRLKRTRFVPIKTQTIEPSGRGEEHILIVDHNRYTVPTTQIIEDPTNDGWPAGYRPPPPQKPDLSVHKYVQIWWPSDECSYGGTIMGMTRGKVDILYDDGTRKTYTQSRIETRISLGEVYIYAYMHAWRNIHG